MSEVDLYYNPDPLFRLIVEPNESEIFVDGEKVTVVIDSGAQISSITISLAQALKLEIKNLRTILDLKATGGLQVPYLGYVEMGLKVPEVKAFDRHVLILVLPNSPYCERIPVALWYPTYRHVYQISYSERIREIWLLLEKGCSNH